MTNFPRYSPAMAMDILMYDYGYTLDGARRHVLAYWADTLMIQLHNTTARPASDIARDIARAHGVAMAVDC